MGIFDSVTKRKKSMAVDSSKKVVKKEKETAKIDKVEETANFVSSVILFAPVVSEKAVSSEAKGIYTFRVAQKATKVDISKEIKKLYGVSPVSVRIINVEGKIVNFGRTSGRRVSWKKAIVSLPKGKQISIHSGV
jgi:large subunit ribosomal protein L23